MFKLRYSQGSAMQWLNIFNRSNFIMSFTTLKGDFVVHSEHTELSEYYTCKKNKKSSIGRGETWHNFKPKKMGAIIKAP